MERTGEQHVFCGKCGMNLSKAVQITYIDGIPVCPWCIAKLNKKIK